MVNCLKYSRLKHSFIALLTLFLLFFPKGGIKVLEIPVTWGYFFLFLIALGCFLIKRLFFDKRTLFCLLALIPFQATSLVTILINGEMHLGYFFSYLIHFFILPILFFLIFPCYIDKSAIDVLFKWIRDGVYFIAIYGLFLFVYKAVTGSFVEIPFLTVNYHDINELEYGKCIDRGGVFKLISTYNNGNLYGVCVLMLLPLYNTLEVSVWRKWIVKSSLILTLSRTIWIGLVVYEVLIYFIGHTGSIRKFIKMSGALLMLVVGLFILMQVFPFSSEFLLDRFLGNRIGQLEVLNHVEWISTQAFDGIYEIIYLGVLRSFGAVGLITFLFAMAFPLMLFRIERGRNYNPEWQGSLAAGLILYCIVACADGALLLIPVMCFYWFLASMLIISMRLDTNPSESSQRTFQQIL